MKKSFQYSAILALICLAILSGCTMGGLDTSGGSTQNVPLGQAPTQKWKVKPGLFMHTTPAAADGVVYVTLEDSCICALDARTGEVKWRVPPPGTGLTSPIVWNDTIYFGVSGDIRLEPEVTSTAYVYALDARTGDGRWRFKVDGAKDEDSAPLTLIDGILYFGSGWSEWAAGRQGSDGHITALDARTGKVLWQIETPGSQSIGFAVGGGAVYFGNGYDLVNDADVLHAADSKSGKELWKVEMSYDLLGDFTVDDERLYVANWEKFLAFDRATGKQLWQLAKEGKTFSGAALSMDRLYLAENEERESCFEGCKGPPKHYSDYLLSIDAKTGNEQRRTGIGSDGPHQVVLLDDVLYYTTFRPNKLKAVDAQIGNLKWELEAEDTMADALALADGVLYFGVDDGSVYALELPGYATPTISLAATSAPALTSAPGNQAVETATVVRQVGPLRGFLAPGFALPDIRTGQQVKLSDFKGKPVFLNFWATWCPPCKKEMPEIQKLLPKYHDRIQFIGVSHGSEDTVDKAKAFVEEGGYTWLFVHDAAADAAASYQVQSIPTSFFIDREGVIRSIHIGSMDGEKLEGYILGLLR